MSIERILNSRWWAQALLERRAIDTTDHVGERAHQKVDPDGHEPHGAEHELTRWERAWVAARVNDAHQLQLEQHNAAATLLGEPLEEHERRELDARARAYFGATHDDTRAALELAIEQMDDREEQNEALAKHDLIDRHIQTVLVDVEEARRVAQAHLDDARLLFATPHAEHVARSLEQVRDEIRRSVSQSSLT